MGYFCRFTPNWGNLLNDLCVYLPVCLPTLLICTSYMQTEKDIETKHTEGLHLNFFGFGIPQLIGLSYDLHVSLINGLIVNNLNQSANIRPTVRLKQRCIFMAG